MSETATPARTATTQRHPLEVRRALPIALLRARETVMDRFRPMLAAHGITEQQWRVLRVLSEDSPLAAKTVAQRALILAPSLSRIIKTLERQGLIARVRDADDGRRAQLRLTDNGRRTIGEITPESLAIYAELEATFGADRVAALVDLLNDLAELEVS